MFSFFNNKNQAQAVPEWAAFFSEKEYQLFLGALTRYFTSKGLTFEIADGVLTTDEEKFGFQKLGLGNVSQVCKQNELSDYFEIVHDHFESLIRNKIFEEEFHEKSSDFDYAKRFLASRIYGIDYVRQFNSDICVTQEIAPGLYVMLVFDLPDSVMNVQPKLLESWGIPLEDLIEIGAKNVREKYEFEILDFQMDDFEIKFIQGDHFFVPNILFDLENHPELIGKYGSLIGVPHRHAALIYPIENIEVIKAVNDLIPVVYGMNYEGPGSVSNRLYLLQNGELIDLPYEMTDEKLSFSPPAPFVQLLNLLAEE